jgi:tRNA(Ile)-lysidine synthase TilS/MesJ
LACQHLTQLHFDLLDLLKADLKIGLVAIHVSLLREEESDREEDYVCKFCQERGLELVVKRVDIFEKVRQTEIY